MVLLHAVLEPLHWLLVSAIHCILTFHWLRQTVPFVLNGPVLISSRLLNRCTSLKTHLYRPVRNEQRCCSATEWLQEGLQKSCKRAGCSSSKFWLFHTAVESPLTAINSAVVAVQKIPESRSALQSGCKVSSKRQRMLLLLMAYHLLVQKKLLQLLLQLVRSIWKSATVLQNCCRELQRLHSAFAFRCNLN